MITELVKADLSTIPLRPASAATLANTRVTEADGCVPVSQAGDWSITHAPTTTLQATISKAAGGAGVRHIATAIAFCLSVGATPQTQISIVLRDGATGAGTILWQKQVTLPANTNWSENITGLNIVGSAATAMTLEFTNSGVTGTFLSVALTGHDAS